MRIKLKDSAKIIISVMAVIAVMVMIFVFSSQNVATSDGLSGQITKVVVRIYIFISDRLGTVANGNGELIEGNGLFADVNHYVRKLAHVTEFALLGAVILIHSKVVKDIRRKSFCRISLLWVTLIGCSYAVTDEFHQYFVEGRGPQVKDVIIDAVGTIIGSTLVFIIISYVNKKRGYNEQTRKTEDGQGTTS